MSRAARLRLHRKIRRAVGRAPEHLVVGIVFLDDRVIYHFKTLAPLAVKFDKTKCDTVQLRESLVEAGFIEQVDLPVWINKRATLDDIVQMGARKITLDPIA